MKLILGDCLEKMKDMEDNSIDSIVTDPPYGISFMGRGWDKGVPPVEVWKECLRVLKPGGYLLSFAGTRTQHRMATNIEDAGFEIRDMIAWVYGCYSEDTEVLTDSGWKSFWDMKDSDKILQWNSDTNRLSWIIPKNKFEYKHKGNMINFSNRHTNQLITPNHSVYAKIRKHSRNEKNENFIKLEAKDIRKNWQIDLPLSGNLESGKHNEHAYIIGWWLTDAWVHEEGKACMFSQSKEKTLNKLREELSNKNCRFSEYTNKTKKENHKQEHTFYVTGELSKYLLENFPERKLTYEVLLWDKKSRFNLVEGLLDGDGSRNSDRGYSEVFWSRKKEKLDIFQALCVSLDMRSHIDYTKGCVYLNRKHNTTQLQSKHKKELMYYEGKIWCLETETGAFVVRREGKAFISGNSGFPKSHNIGKAIDKVQGNERNIVGVNAHPTSINRTGTKSPYQLEGSPLSSIFEITVPYSKEAKQWEGWGTALKPALEPITVARKPIAEKTVAENVLKYGTGGINIDGCRVETDEKLKEQKIKGSNGGEVYGKYNLEGIYTPSSQGRWPANLIHDGSEEVTSLFPDSKSTGGSGDKSKGGLGKQIYGKYSLEKHGSNAGGLGDSGSASRFFYCAKASKKDRNEGCDDLEEKQYSYDGRNKSIENAYQRNNSIATNNHPTVKPTNLMRYLVRLVTPKQGTVLDPFMGSGSTGKACILEGFDFIGIDLEEEYIKIAEKRINKAKEIKESSFFITD